MTTEVITPYLDSDQTRPRVLHVALSGDYQQEDKYPLALFSNMGAIQERSPSINQSAAIVCDIPSLLETVNSQEKKPDILTVSAQQGTLELLRQIVNSHDFDNIPHILLGGALPTLIPQKQWEHLLQRYAGVFLLRGWSEGIIGDVVLQMLSNENTSNLCGVEKPNEPFLFPIHPPANHYPTQYGVPVSSPKNSIARVESSRQCDHGTCVFCQHLCPHTWSPYPVDDIVQQIYMLNRVGGYQLLEFVDEDLIGGDIFGATQLMERIVDCQRDGTLSRLRFAINMRTTHLSAKTVRDDIIDRFLQIAKNAGLSVIFNGGESYSKTTLDTYGKRITPEDNLRGILRAHKHGLSIGQGFIPFHPLMKKQEALEMAQILSDPEIRRLIESAVPQPFGFLHVDVNSPYLTRIRTECPQLVGDIDWNLLRVATQYQDPSIGLLVAIFKVANSLRRTAAKKYIYPSYLGDKHSKIRMAAEVNHDFNLMLNGFSVLFREYGNLQSILEKMVPIVSLHLKRAFSSGEPLELFFSSGLLNELKSFIGDHSFYLADVHQMQECHSEYSELYESKRRNALLHITKLQSLWEIANAYASHQRASEIALVFESSEQDNENYKKYLEKRTIDAQGSTISRDVVLQYSMRRTPLFKTLVLNNDSGSLELVSRKYEDIIPENELLDTIRSINWQESANNIEQVHEYLTEKMEICAKKLSNDELDLVMDFLQRLKLIKREILLFLQASSFEKQKHFEMVIWMLNDLWKQKNGEETDHRLAALILSIANAS